MVSSGSISLCGSSTVLCVAVYNRVMTKAEVAEGYITVPGRAQNSV